MTTTTNQASAEEVLPMLNPNNDTSHGTSSNTTTTGTRPRRRNNRRVFSLGSLRFRILNSRLVDAVLEGLSWFIESVVYLIGPLLIVLALSIMSLLTYSYFTILLPMMQEKYIKSPWKNLILGLHTVFVIFILGNVLFHYFCCVTTKHKGPLYDKVVRELAAASDIGAYPETPAQIQRYKKDYEDKMYLRIKRRRARAAAEIAQTSEAESSSSSQQPTNSMTQRHMSSSTNGTKAPPNNSNNRPAPPVRAWMLMGPYEWGYCRDTNQPKPPRSHYDHVSKTLVLNLDHYCPWMFNAIGYFNYRYFVSFLIYIFVGMMYGVSVTFEPFQLLRSSDYRRQYRNQEKLGGIRPHRLQPMLPYREEKMLVTLSFMLCAAVGLAILLLGGFHIYLTFSGQTTIEFHGNWVNRRKARAANRKWSNPYSRGSARLNWEQVFGEHSWLLWSILLPSRAEPQFLPVVVPGHSGRRQCTPKQQDPEGTKFAEEEESSEHTLASSGQRRAPLEV